jgi:hypothetical protein
MGPGPTLAIHLLKQCFSGPGQLSGAIECTPHELDWLYERKLDSLYYIYSGSDSSRQALYDKIQLLQAEALVDLLRELSSAHVHAIVLKGAFFCKQYFRGRGLSFNNDVDLLVRKQLLGQAKHVLLELGYRQAYVDAKSGRLLERHPFDVAIIESEHYELAPFKRLLPLDLPEDQFAFAQQWNNHPLWVLDGQAYVELDFDIHHGLAYDVEGAELFERAILSPFPNGFTLTPADHLWYTTSKYYNEVALHGKFSLREFAYLAGLLGAGQVDWGTLIDAVDTYGIAFTLYYYFTFLTWLRPGAIPSDVIAHLKDSYPRKRDFGWQLHQFADSPFPLG